MAFGSPDKDFQLESAYFYPTGEDGNIISNTIPVIAEVVSLASSSDSVYDIGGFQNHAEAESSIKSVEDSIYSNFAVVSGIYSDLPFEFYDEQF
jgi:hypothetical protein